MHDYIPKRETLLAPWIENFSALISATPGAYALMPSDAAAISAAALLFTDSLTLVLNPATRTRPKVADKNIKKQAMLDTVRHYAQGIKHNLGVSNQAKVSLGLRLDGIPAPVPAPTTEPILFIASGAPFQQVIRYADATTLDKKAKPPGVTSLLLVVAVAAPDATRPPDPATLPTCGILTRQNFFMTFDVADKGKTACYYGRWLTAAGLMGPWSVLAQRMIAG